MDFLLYLITQYIIQKNNNMTELEKTNARAFYEAYPHIAEEIAKAEGTDDAFMIYQLLSEDEAYPNNLVMTTLGELTPEEMQQFAIEYVEYISHPGFDPITVEVPFLEDYWKPDYIFESFCIPQPSLMETWEFKYKSIF